MDDSFDRQESYSHPSGGFAAAALQVFAGILHWLASFTILTEQEEKDAGIYLGDSQSRDW